MRTIKYRDVLWGCAYRMGLDPAKDFLQDQQDALADYINAWVRRLYDIQDWPEWTKIIGFEADTNLVAYELHTDTHTAGGNIERIGRVFDVYLLDPKTTSEPFPIPFRLTPDGIFVGFEHGPTVWIKYIPACPQFTSTPWISDWSYAKGDVVYLSKTGECYKSKANNNIGNDPSAMITPGPPVVTEITQLKTADQPGVMATNQVTLIGLTGVQPGPDPASVPAVNDAFFIEVKDTAGVLLGSASELGNGIKTLGTITTNLATSLSMVGFTVTPDPLAFTIQLSAAQEFVISWAYYQPFNGIKNKLKVVKTQSYVPAVAGAAGTPQITKSTLTTDHLLNGSTYQVGVIDTDGIEHIAEYSALPTDSISQVISGLASSIQDSLDPFFQSVSVSVDLTLGTLTFSTDAEVSVNLDVVTPSSAWWEVVPFPLALADQMIRGGVSDVLREEGQTDRADGEEQKVTTETTVAGTKFTTPQFKSLTDQQKPKSRYSVK